ncbi:MAG: ATP phosphoribosyltransferase regulatory subunit, partial [archaeon]|nr:ATP phosphoribosyltransferase regulatory subunit [archaeon]
MAESNSRMDDEKPGIPLQPVKGMRDILGKPARVKRWVEQIIYQKALQYGFEPMQVPVIEYYDLLAAKGGAGDAVQKEMFRLEDQSKRQLGLRFEFTTSLARVVIGNPDLPKPIKSFNLGTVYRYENPQAFRYREFTQGDVDIIGSPFPEADAECLSFAIDTMRALGFEDFSIRLNDRRIM